MTDKSKSAGSDQPEAEKLDKATRELLRKRDAVYAKWAAEQEQNLANMERFETRQAEMQANADKSRGA